MAVNSREARITQLSQAIEEIIKETKIGFMSLEVLLQSTGMYDKVLAFAPEMIYILAQDERGRQILMELGIYEKQKNDDDSA